MEQENFESLDLKHFAMVFEVTAQDLEYYLKILIENPERAEQYIQNIIPAAIKLCKERGNLLREFDKKYEKVIGFNPK